jgi:hypothetical protein
METLGFTPVQELDHETSQAYVAIPGFCVTWHDRARESGVGRPEPKRPTQSKTKPEP